MPTGSVTPAGGGGPAAGSYLPVGSQSGVTLDTTTYNDPVRGGGAKLATLVFGSEGSALAIAHAGDSFPRWLFTSNPDNGLYFSRGTVDPYTHGAYIVGGSNSSVTLDASQSIGGSVSLGIDSAGHIGLGSAAAVTADGVLNAAGVATAAISSGALPTQAFVSGTGAQVSTTRDVVLVVPFTGDATNNAATLKIELSPDNSTYSTLDTLSIAAALNLTGALNVPTTLQVPLGWYVKLTATHGTIGTATYY